MTPDTVETRVGTFKFFDGLPTKETSQKVYDNLDFMRAVEVFLNFVPAASIEAIRLGLAEQGVSKSNQVMIFDQLADSNPLFLTANTDTVYAMVTETGNLKVLALINKNAGAAARKGDIERTVSPGTRSRFDGLRYSRVLDGGANGCRRRRRGSWRKATMMARP